MENIAVGSHLHIAGRAAALAAAADVAKLVGLDAMLQQPASTLTVSGRKRLELARALATTPKLLLLDEVLAGLNPSEIRDVLPIIRAIRERGVTILMIEHVMQAVMSLAEKIYVLVEGRVIAQGPPAAVAADPKVIEAYLGAGAAARLAGGAHGLIACALNRFCKFAACTPATAKPRSCAASISWSGPATSWPCSVRMAPENRRSISRFPDWFRPRGGSIEFDGRFIHDASPSAIVASGLIHVPEGRRIFPNMSVADNLDLGSYRRAASRRAANREQVFSMFPRLRERASQRAGTLSGGEQQMLAIGRGLMAEPKLLILDEPSLGLSPLLVEEMFAMILRLNKDGLAVLLVEQNVVQSLDIVHRAYILEHGSFVMSGSAADIRSNADLKRAFLGL